MAAKKYIAINAASNGTEERDLLKDVGEFAYVNRGVIVAPFDVHSLKIGSYEFNSSNWTNVTHAPTKLAPKGHFLVWQGDNTKEIRYITKEADATTVDCIKSRCAELIITDGDAESWNYFAQGQTFKNGEISFPSAFDAGRAKDLNLRVFPAEYVRESAFLNRGKRVGPINFDTTTLPGRYAIDNPGGFAANGSKKAPPTSDSSGDLEVFRSGCAIRQVYYPSNGTGLLFRERLQTKAWGQWFASLEGTTREGNKIKVPASWRRGMPNGFDWVETYDASTIDNKAIYTPGYGISIVGNVISYTGSTTPIYGVAPINYNPATGAISLGSLAISQTAGLQAALDSKLSSYTETDPTVPSWVKAITSTQIAHWDSALGHTHSWSEITGKPTTLSGYGITDAYTKTELNTSGAGGAVHWNNITNKPSTFTPSAHTHPYTEVTGIVAGTGITYVGGVIASTITQYTDALATAAARAAISGGGLLSYNSTTGLMSLSTVPWANISGAPDFSGSYVPLARTITINGTAGNIAISNNTQTLLTNRAWQVDLEYVHAAPVSGGSGTQIAQVFADRYGRVTGINNVNVAFPVTSVNGLTGAVVLTTTNIAEGTNLYWTTARGDARYSLLGHGHIWTEISGKPLTFAPSAHTHPYTEVTGIVAGTGITYVGGVIASTITQYTDALATAAARAAISGGGLLSYNSTTGLMSLSTVPWANITGTPDFAGTYVPLSRTITINGTTGNIAISNNTQSLFANRAWQVDLEYVHAAPVSGGSGTQIAQVFADRYGRVTGINNITLNSDNVTEGTTNKYYTDGRVQAYGDARYSQLGHTHNFTLLTGKPTTLAGYGITDAVGGSGTTNYVTKFTAAGTVGNSQMTDDGSFMKVGTVSSIGKFGVQGAIWASADASAVSYYVAGGGAVRAFGTMYLDAYDGDMYLRTGAGYTQTIIAKATGQVRFPTYTSSSSWSGTAAGLLGFDSSGNIITYQAVRTNAQNDAQYAPYVHDHDSSYYTKSQSDARYTQYGHNHDDRYYTKTEGDSRYSAAGHNHHYDYYTKTELNTSGAGGSVHWNNLTGVPGLSYAGHNHDDRYYTEGEVNSMLSGKSDNGHTHDDRYYTEGEVNSLLSGKADWGHNHDDRYYTESESDSRYAASGHNHHYDYYQKWESDSRYLQYETDPTEVTGLSASVGSNYMQLYIGKKNGSTVGSGVIDLSNIRDADPYGVSGVGLSMDNATTLRVTIYLRNGGNYQATCIIFTGG